MIIVSVLICIILGSGLIGISIRDAINTSKEIDSMYENQTRKKRIKKKAIVENIGINTDFPTIIFNWPEEKEEDGDDFLNRLKSAKEEKQKILLKRIVFGNVHIEYKYKTPDGDIYYSRAVSRIPNKERHKKIALRLREGNKIPCYINEDDYSDSVLIENTSDEFEAYKWEMTKPYIMKIGFGAMLIFIAVIAPATFTDYMGQITAVSGTG